MYQEEQVNPEEEQVPVEESTESAPPEGTVPPGETPPEETPEEEEGSRTWLWVLLAAIGVAYLTFQYGKLPWISLYLAFSFGFYGLIRKVAPVGALIGLTVETLLLLLPALGCLIYFDSVGAGAFLRVDIKTDVLLILYFSFHIYLRDDRGDMKRPRKLY